MRLVHRHSESAPLYYDVLQLSPRASPKSRNSCASMPSRTSSRSCACAPGLQRIGYLALHRSSNDTTRPTACTGDGTTSMNRREPRNRLDGNPVDPRNVFAFSTRAAGLAEFPFKHAGGEAIFACRTASHAFYIAKRRPCTRLDGLGRNRQRTLSGPDRSVEAGVCMSRMSPASCRRLIR